MDKFFDGVTASEQIVLAFFDKFSLYFPSDTIKIALQFYSFRIKQWYEKELGNLLGDASTSSL